MSQKGLMEGIILRMKGDLGGCPIIKILVSLLCVFIICLFLGLDLSVLVPPVIVSPMTGRLAMMWMSVFRKIFRSFPAMGIVLTPQVLIRVCKYICKLDKYIISVS